MPPRKDKKDKKIKSDRGVTDKKPNLDRYEIVKELSGISDDNTTAFLCKDSQSDNALRVLRRKSLEDISPEEYVTTVPVLHPKLNHPNIVKYYDGFHENGFHCIVQEYYEEGELSAMINVAKESNSLLEEETVVDILVQLLQGMQYIHSQGLLHPGITTRRIFLKGKTVVIGGLEVSRHLTEGNTENVFLQPILSPEALKHEQLTTKSDVWSIGCILYEMCAQKPPFVYGTQTTLMEFMYRIVQEETPQLPENYSRSLNSIFQKMLMKNPEERPSLDEILQSPIVVDQITKIGMQTEAERKIGYVQSVNGEKSESKDVPEQRRKTLTVADVDESQDFLQQLNLKSYQRMVSAVYRCDADDEAEVSVPVTNIYSAGSSYIYFYFVQRDKTWSIFPACFEAGSVSGRVSPIDMFCVVAEIKPETVTVDERGKTYISTVDNRVKVDIPQGAVDTETDFGFRLESVDKHRYRLYEEHLEDVFSCVVGLPTFINIEHKMKGLLKKKARVYLPVSGDRQDSEILFLHWEGDTVTPLKHKEDTTSSGTSYYVEVDHFCGISVLLRKIRTTISEAISRIKLILGKTSICTVLTYILPGYIENMPGLSVVCAEAHQTHSVSKSLVDEGLLELPCSRSDNFTIKEGGFITVEVSGNIDVHPVVRQRTNGLKLKFSRNSCSNRVMVPITVQRPKVKLSNITYTVNETQWEHSVYFSVFKYIHREPIFPTHRDTGIKGGLAKMSKDLLSGLPQKASSSSEETTSELPPTVPPVFSGLPQKGSSSSGETTPELPPSVPPVLSERSLVALVRFLPDDTLFYLGIELGMTSDQMKCILGKNKGSFSAGYTILTEWLRRNFRKADHELVDDLMAAFEEIGRVDIAEIIREASEMKKPIRSGDFEGGL